MARHPAARASAARDMLAFTDVYRPGAMQQIRELVPGDSLRVIDSAAGVAWLGVEHDHWLMDGTMAVLGQQGAIECWHRAMSMMVNRPLLRPLVEGAQRLFFGEAGEMIALIAKGWGLAYRDFCTPRYEADGPSSAHVVFEDVAREAFASPGYLHCWHAVCRGIAELEKVEHSEVAFAIDEPRRRAIATFSWR